MTQMSDREQELFSRARRRGTGTDETKPKHRVLLAKAVAPTTSTKELEMSTVDKAVDEGQEFVKDSVEGAKMGMPAAAAGVVHQKMVSLLKSKGYYPDMLAGFGPWQLVEPWLAVGMFRLILSVAPDTVQDNQIMRTARWIGVQATKKKAADIVEALGIEVFAVVEDIVKTISPFMTEEK